MVKDLRTAKSGYGLMVFAGFFYLIFYAGACSNAKETQSKFKTNCESSNPDVKESAVRDQSMLPGNARVDYRKNGTPAMIKGEALDTQLMRKPAYAEAKKKGSYTEAAFQLLESWRSILKLKAPREELSLIDMEEDAIHAKHVKLQQEIRGVPVWGKTMTLHFGSNDAVYLFQGDYIPSSDKIITEPEILPEAAVRKAVTASSGKKGAWNAVNVRLYVYAPEAGDPRLAHGVTLVHGLSERDLWFIDAATGQVLHRISMTTNR